ncbi:MAG: glycerol-3-phosphate acyltransferase [Anaerolineae bacterium]
MTIFIWALLGLACGSIPFSVIVGRLATGVDIRQYGDHNPGAANVLRAAGWGWFVLAALLDYLKAALPAGIPWFFLGISGWGMMPIALAPVLGHAWSPWLSWRGGKAVAATFGMWTALTLGAGPIMLGLLLSLIFAVVERSGWAVLIAMLGFGGFLWRQYGASHPEFVAIWLGNLAVLMWKYRQDLGHLPGIRPWLLRLV